MWIERSFIGSFYTEQLISALQGARSERLFSLVLKNENKELGFHSVRLGTCSDQVQWRTKKGGK